MVQKSTLHLAKGMVGIAMSAVLLGVLLIGLTSWKVPGGVILTYGLLTLYLSYHVSTAPCLDEPGPDPLRTPITANVDYQETLEELTAEALANNRI